MIPLTSGSARTQRTRPTFAALRAVGVLLGLSVVVSVIPEASAIPLAQGSQPTPSSTAPQAPRSRNATFGIQPATRSKPDSRTYFSIAATAGATLTDQFAIRNYSTRPLFLTVQTADGLNTPEGAFTVLPPNQPSKQVGTWITLFPPGGSKKVVVPGRGYLVVPFSVKVPTNAQPGDHAGGITVTLESSARSSSGQLVKLLQSVGSRVFIRVSGPLKPELTVENLHVRYDATLWPIQRKTAIVTYTVRNTGNVVLGGLQNVKIAGLLRLGATAKNPPRIEALLPGFSVDQRIEVSGVIPQVWMNADVTITPLVLAGTTQRVRDAFTASAHFWAVPWLLIGIILVIAAGWLLHRRRKRRRARSDTKPPPGPAERGAVRAADEDRFEDEKDRLSL